MSVAGERRHGSAIAQRGFAVTHQRPPPLDPVPDRLEAVLDPAWLSSALADLPPSYRVTDVVVEEISTTVASKIRFRVRAEGPEGEDCERAYCVKGHFDGGNLNSLGGETRFYRELAPLLDMRTPQAHYTGIDTARGRCLIVMDDVIAQGGRFLSAHEAYPIDMARQTLCQLARLHAATWRDEGAPVPDWLAPRMRQMVEGFPTPVLHELLNDGRGPDLPDVLRDAETLKEAVVSLSVVPPVCVIHGDTHSGNVYVDRFGQPGWLDWQVVQSGHWATDVSYHLATSLAVDDRRAHEEELLRGYLEELGHAGVAPPAWGEAWEHYRRHFPWGYFLWAITRISSREVVLIHIPRIAAAMEDHDTLGLLGVI